jgi:thioredoxin-related protein
MTIFIFLITLFVSAHEVQKPVVTAQSKSLYSYSLERLDSFSKFNLSSINGKKSVWILFQPECKSCESQFNDLTCLDIATQKVALGFWGHREKLLKTIRFTKFDGLRLISSKEIESALSLKLTPTLLIVDSKGFIKETIYALTPCNHIKKKLESAT